MSTQCALCAEQDRSPAPVNGTTAELPVLSVPGEVFALRKLLPATVDYDFNIHIMDFQPGESLNVKVRSLVGCERGSDILQSI